MGWGEGSFLGTSKEERGSCDMLHFKDLLAPRILAENVLMILSFGYRKISKFTPTPSKPLMMHF